MHVVFAAQRVAGQAAPVQLQQQGIGGGLGVTGSQHKSGVHQHGGQLLAGHGLQHQVGSGALAVHVVEAIAAAGVGPGFIAGARFGAEAEDIGRAHVHEALDTSLARHTQGVFGAAEVGEHYRRVAGRVHLRQRGSVDNSPAAIN